MPCATLRDETEWIELIDSGWNCLAPPSIGEVISTTMYDALGRKGEHVQLYGQGDAAEKIITKLKRIYEDA